ncbi:MAG: hypothetical protein IBX49_11170 [Gammaproteobacteria bacterium]|nr:hypothetical protein [Gammaproteobacteria bacterium]
MTFPTINDALKALVIALILAVAGFFLFPLFALEDPRESLVIALALGAFIGILLHRLQFAAREVSSSADGETSTLFVGNLAFKASQDELSALFNPFTTVHSVRIMKDRATRRPRGFAFVEIDSKHSAKAIKKLDGLEFHGRKLRVNVSNKAAQNNE